MKNMELVIQPQAKTPRLDYQEGEDDKGESHLEVSHADWCHFAGCGSKKLCKGGDIL